MPNLLDIWYIRGIFFSSNTSDLQYKNITKDYVKTNQKTQHPLSFPPILA